MASQNLRPTHQKRRLRSSNSKQKNNKNQNPTIPTPTGDLGYYLGDYGTPSPSQKDGDTGYESEFDSEDEEPQTEANRYGDEEHGIFLELPVNEHIFPKCSVVFNTVRILKDHLTETHGLRDIIFRCRLCRTTFERVHRLECHAPRCKTGKGSPSETLHPEKCETCTRRFPTKSAKSQHERHRHPETANQRRINAAKLEAQRKRDKRHAAKELEKLEAERRRTKFYEANEAPILKTEWDAAAVEILLTIYLQMGNIRGLHAIVRTALQAEGYDISLKRISERKRTKGFMFAAENKQKKKSKEKAVAPDYAGEAARSTPKLYPNSQETVNERVQLDNSTVETLLLSLETSGDESEAGIAALCRTVHEAGKEDEATKEAYTAHEKLLGGYIAPKPLATEKGAKIPRYRKETKVRKIRTKTLKGKVKERVEKYRTLQQKWTRNRKNAVKLVLDGASDAKCQIDTEVIEATYAERFECAGPTVNLSNYPGPVTEPPSPLDKAPTCDRILDAVTASEVRKAVRAMKTGSAAGPDRITVAQLKKKTEESPGFLAGV